MPNPNNKPEITHGDVIAAEAQLSMAKNGHDREALEAAKQHLNTIRSAWREQEVAAGRRSGLVGGDAQKEI